MKLPREAIDELLTAEEARRAEEGAERAHEEAAARARELAATDLVASIEVLSPRPRPRIRPSKAPTEGRAIIERVFANLARPGLAQHWEELAAAARLTGLDELSTSIDHLAIALGRPDEATRRVEAAVTASQAEIVLGAEDVSGGGAAAGGAVAGGATEGGATAGGATDGGWRGATAQLAWRDRIESLTTVVEVVMTETGWFATDISGQSVRVKPGATLAALVSESDSGPELASLLTRNEALGIYCIPIRCRFGEGRDWIRLS